MALPQVVGSNPTPGIGSLNKAPERGASSEPPAWPPDHTRIRQQGEGELCWKSTLSAREGGMRIGEFFLGLFGTTSSAVATAIIGVSR